ncbi:Methyltransferase-like protein 24, partial [Quaeritorhiza haematococci]
SAHIDLESESGLASVSAQEWRLSRMRGKGAGRGRGIDVDVEDPALRLGVKPPPNVKETLAEGLFHLLQRRSYECNDLRKIGGARPTGTSTTSTLHRDGEWSICFDFLSPLSLNTHPAGSSSHPQPEVHLNKSKNCTVYSVGINNDFSFDDHIHKITGCSVHSFDPSMGLRTFPRGKNKFFYDIGLGGNSTDQFTRGFKYSLGTKHGLWKMRTLGDLMKQLGHER